jgi:hypothetical protein
MWDLSNADRQVALAIELAKSALQAQDEYLAEFLETLQTIYQFEGISGICRILLSPLLTQDALAIINNKFAAELGDNSQNPGVLVTEAESSCMVLGQQPRLITSPSNSYKLLITFIDLVSLFLTSICFKPF